MTKIIPIIDNVTTGAEASDRLNEAIKDVEGEISGINSPAFENTLTKIFASSVNLDLSARLNHSIEITGDITIDASNLADGQTILIECTINTATPPTITLAAKFKALDDGVSAPSAIGDVFYIIGFVDGTNINYDIRTKTA